MVAQLDVTALRPRAVGISMQPVAVAVAPVLDPVLHRRVGRGRAGPRRRTKVADRVFRLAAAVGVGGRLGLRGV